MRQDWTDKLREKMDGYTEQPSEKVWAGISGKTGALSHARRKAAPWIWSGSAAAALVAGALMFHTNVDEPITDNVEVLGQRPTEAVAMAEDGVKPAEKATGRTASAGLQASASVENKVKAPMPAMKTMKVNADETAPVQEGIDTDEDATWGEVPVPAVKAPKANADETAPVQEGIDTDEDAWREYLAGGEERTGRKRKLSAGLSVNGSGGGTSMESRPTNAVLGANPLEASVSNADWMSSQFKGGMIVYNKPEVKTEYSHRMPVHIGASVRYEFSKRLGLETGLTYSLLSSDLKTGTESTDGSWSKGVQTLHYLGIPLNLSFSIVDSRLVNVYISAGGMMEKGVRGSIKTDEYINGRFHDSSEHSITPKGLQWSVNASAGIQLNILPQLGLFMEPGISHHFRNGSHIRSVYSDKPTDFSLGFGLRYSLRK